MVASDGDPRRAFVLNSVADAVAVGEAKDRLLGKLEQENSPAIAAFLDDASINLLQASVTGISTGSPNIVFSNVPEFPAGCEYQLLLAKLVPGPLRATDVPMNVVVSSVAHSPLASLYHSLRTVYGPLLGHDAAPKGANGDANGVAGIVGNPKLQDLLAQLEAGLGTALRGGGKTGTKTAVGPDGPDKAPLLGVLRPEDEFQMWAELAGGAGSAGLQKRAAEISKHLDPLWRSFSELGKGEMMDKEEAILELLDNTQEALDAVWGIRASDGPDGWAYQQRRMEHLMNLIGAALMGHVQASLKGTNIWNSDFRDVERKLRGGLRIVGRWEHITNELAAMQWADHGQGRHAWKGKYVDATLASFRERVDECLKMREANEELRKLLTAEEANSLNVDHVFAPFALVNTLHISEYVEPLWAAAKEEYERRMEPIEERLSQKLKELFGSVLIPSLTAAVSKHGERGGTVAQPHQVFREFKRYGGLLSRPLISAKLQGEKDTLAKQVDTHLDNILRDFQAREDAAARNIKKSSSADAGRNLPVVVDHIVWALQAQTKVEETQHALEYLTGGEEGSNSALGQCLALCNDLRKDIEEFKIGQHNAWGEEVMDRLEEIKIEKTGKLMDFHVADGHVNLHFNDELVSLLREVRALQALGFAIPSSIKTEVSTANKFYRQGMVLKQVANFYNDIATQMIPCQKPMMLDDAKKFEDVLTNPRDGLGKPLTWANVTALDTYVGRLQEVANRLTEKNRKLRKWHKVIGEKVITLMGTDLVRQRDKWVSGIKEIRAIFNNLENEGFSRPSQANWRLHWDYQIYKALEYQYHRGLECLNEALPQMELKMVFKQRKLQYEPPLEELRTTHYKQHIKTYISLPLNLKGVSDASERTGFFRHMVDAASGGIAKVYTASEILFAKLHEELKKLQDWVALGTVDLDSFVDERLHEVSDWELNFKYLKLAAKEADKIPMEVKVDCYTVTLLPVKNAIEEHMKQLQEALIASLRRKTAAEKAEVEEFVKNGKDALEQQFTSVEEIGKARANAKDMINKVSHILNLRRKVEDKNKLIRQMATAIGSNSAAAGGGAAMAAVDMTDLNNEWETFQNKLQQHETHLEDQKSQLKGQIERNITDFKSKVNGFASRWHEFKPKGAPEGDPQLMLAKMEDDALTLTDLMEEAKKMQEECEHFQMEAPDFQALEDVKADIENTKIAWSRYGEFLKDRDELAKRDWISMRDEVWRVEDFLAKWQDTGKVAGKIAGNDPVAMILMKEIDAYRRAIPHLKYVRGNGWEKKHWNKLFDMLKLPTKGPNAVTPENLTLAHFLDKADNLAKASEDIKELDSQAQGESVLRKALDELNVWGYDRSFTLTEHVSTAGGGSRRTSLIKEWKDILTEVGDHQSLIGSLKQSKYYVNFKDEASAWETRLANLQDGLAALNQIQRKWVYLEPIFARGALPQQQARFRRVDDEFRGLMATVESNPLVTNFADVPRLNETLPQMVSQLEICQKALTDFLEEKRQIFPRFYFIGDDDLLEILGQSKNPEVIQTHLKKLFAGIHSVVFSDDFGYIKAMQSIEKEVVPLVNPVEVSEAVEVWLNDLAKSMVGTLKSGLPGCIKAKDFKTHPSQLLNLAEMVTFTSKAESAIQRNALPQLQKDLRALLAEYTSADYTGYRVMQLKLQALVLDLIHNIEIVEQLISSRCQDLVDWAWSKQLRYYSNESGAARIKMAEGDFEYTYEYQGNAPKLVYTPLTDKCYLTLTQGMALGYGGNPYGPAGTGKTESVKALGQAMARQVLVFNCDEQFDFKSMGRIFMGLVKCGAWGCFDEFNRLEEEVLSAVSQQIQQIQGALKDRSPSIEFMGQQTQVDFNAGIFVTLNPAGKGYGGRSKLPDNLKQLFRSVAMTVPNNALIAEVLLLSEGIRAARDIGRKTVSLFSLSKQLLSPQQHYDWGLRALKTVLGISGRLLQERRATGAGPPTPEEETDLVLQAVKVTTLPKLTYGDYQRFLKLLADVFPGASHSNTTDPEVEAAIKQAMEDMHLEPLAAQVEKVLQLHLACVQRIGIIIVGPSGAGKSILWRILEGAYKYMGRPVKTHIMNPKAMHRQRLLGHMDMDTREMFDGVLTAASRQVVKEPLEQHSWIICDGDVDPEWIESLNSVLDDNRLLTLPSGERIQFASNINFIFECHSLEFASPATVSRCGMLYLSEENIDVGRLLTSWVKRVPANVQQNMSTWIGDYFTKALEFAESQPQAVETSKLGMVNSCLSQVRDATTKKEFCMGLARGFGANMEPDARQELVSFLIRLTSEGDLLETPVGATIQSIIRGEDDDGVGSASTGNLVVTRDTLVNASLIAAWLRRGEPVLLVGPEGCGKAVLLEQCFAELRGTTTAVVNCSAQTTAENAIQKLSQMCGKPVSTNTGRVLRPRSSDRLILYLKDINLPRPDKYKTIQIISFLQQIITYNGFYDEHLEFIGLERVQIVASMNPSTTVGRHPISTRFTAIARCAYMTYPDREQLLQVYSKMLKKALVEAAEHNAMWANEGSAAKLSGSMLEIYDAVKREFSPDDQRHYQFTPRNLTEWVGGLQRLRSGVEVLDGFVYEASRIFRDRLVGDDSKSTFDSIVRNVMTMQWQWRGFAGGEDSILSTLGVSIEERLDSKLPPPALAQWEADDFHELVAGKLKQYEREQKELGLLLFPEVLQRVAILDRALSLPGGSMLLCGRSGVGRRSATSLVAYIHHLELFTPSVTGNYDLKSFKNDIKTIMQKTGGDNLPVLLFMEDHHIMQNTFLEYINSLLSGGEVPGLFSNEELEGILAPLRDVMASEGFQYASPFDFFTARVKRNLRIILSMDPTNPNYRERCEANPALFTRCSIVWSENWSRTGLETLPAVKLKDVMDGSQDLIQSLMAMYESMLPYGATPRHYCTQVEMYKRIYQSKREELVQQQTFLKSGLSKLAEAEATVDTLSREANDQQQELGRKESEANEAMQRITVSIGEASERRKEVESLQSRLAVEEGELHEKKGGIEVELTEVQPMLDAARKAVGQIKSDNINEIRSLKMPPDAIRDVLEGVLRILGQQDMSWANMKKFLGSRVVKDEIINFDAHKITPGIRKDVDKLLTNKANSFEHAVIHRVSVAASPLAAWVKANLKFSLVLEKIAPLEDMLAKLTASLASSKTRLVECEEELQVLDQRVVEMKDEFAKKTGEAETLKIGLKRAKDTLSAAESLLGKLSGEKGRWVTQVDSLGSQIDELPLHVLMAAGFITYLPQHPEDIRMQVQAQWSSLLGIHHVDGLGYDVRRFMSSESEMLIWKSEGLPGDELSMENGIAILNSTLSPLIIDPANAASDWLKGHLTKGGAPVEAVTSYDPRFGNALELAVRFGKTLVVTDVDTIPPLLYPLLRLDLIRSGPRFAVQLGDKTVDYNEAFKLYLVTRNPEIAIPPDAATLVSIANFTITRSGLESQLLGLTIGKEQPELESQKSQLLKQEEGLRVELAELERSLLQSLATSSGNLLENKELLDSLNETKSKSATISTSLEEGHKLQITLDQQRNAYSPIAQRGSTMYFLVRELSAINHMYQISLAVFLEIFKRALNAEDHSTDIGSRLAVLNATLLRLVYGYVSRYLFNADRLTLGMHMAHHLAGDQFQGEEWDLFIGKLVANEAAVAQAQHQRPSWVPEECSGSYAQLVTAFPALAHECELQNAQLWSPWLQSAEAERELPQRAGAQLTAFQTLLVVQAFRPDRLQSGMSSFVCNALGMKSVAPESFSIKTLYQGEMVPEQPVLFIASPGADPTQELADFADRTVGRDRYHEVAMGQGQGAVAIDLLRQCARSGDWLCLKNLHLVVSFLPSLQKEIFSLAPNPEFRLFLTSEPHDKFPASLLENCLKVTFEAPPGLKKNLLRTYEFWTPEYVADGPPVRAQLLFALAWFHAVVQERRRYIPQGWSKFYEFSFADLRSGADIINLRTKGGSGPQWEYLHGLLENAIYGGRVDNPFDLKVLNTYLEQFFSSDVIAVGGSGRVKSLPGTKNISIPSSAHHGDYVALISSLSETDSPTLFSLPSNIDRAAQQANSGLVVGQLKAMGVASSASGGFNRALWSKQLGPLLKLWDQLMTANSGLRQAFKPPAGLDSWGPVESFVALERTNAQRLIGVIDKNINQLGRVMRGADSLSPSVQAVGSALIREEIPGIWDSLWEGPESPLVYCRSVVARAVAIEQWFAKAQQGQLLSSRSLDLGELFNPITFLNALRQQSARQLSTSVDNLKLVTCWDASKLRSPVVAGIGGLLIQGANFDGARIGPTSADAPTNTSIPAAAFAWIPKDEPHPYNNFTVVPLYVTADRAKLLAEVQMPVVSQDEAVQWTLSGVALFLGI